MMSDYDSSILFLKNCQYFSDIVRAPAHETDWQKEMEDLKLRPRKMRNQQKGNNRYDEVS